eukprot:scaffold1821_cov344-Pavlova_lutheri.AAC.52
MPFVARGPIPGARLASPTVKLRRPLWTPSRRSAISQHFFGAWWWEETHGTPCDAAWRGSRCPSEAQASASMAFEPKEQVF